MARQQTDMCSKLVKESYKKAFQCNALHGTYELGRLAAELKVIPFWSFDLSILSGTNFNTFINDSRNPKAAAPLDFRSSQELHQCSFLSVES